MKYYPNEPKFKGVYSKNNLPKIKDGTYVLNLDDYKSAGAIGHTVTSVDSFQVECIPKETKKFIDS